MGADARWQASHFACAKVTDHAEPVVQVPCDGATPALAITSSGIQAEVLISAEYLGLGRFLGHGRSRDEQDNYSENEQAAHISSCERIMLGIVSIIAGIATAIQGVFDSSFLLVNRGGRNAGDASAPDACFRTLSVAPNCFVTLRIRAARPSTMGHRSARIARDRGWADANKTGRRPRDWALDPPGPRRQGSETPVPPPGSNPA